MGADDVRRLPLYREFAFRVNVNRAAHPASSVDGSYPRKLRREKSCGAGSLEAGGQNLTGRLYMSRSKLALIAVMTLLSTGAVLYPQNPANAAKFCAQLRGATAAGQPNCSFSTLEACCARVKHRGGGHCYKLTH
jgi:hypothetical protein